MRIVAQQNGGLRCSVWIGWIGQFVPRSGSRPIRTAPKVVNASGQAIRTVCDLR